MNFKKIGILVTSKFVGTGHFFYKKKNYPVAVSQSLRNTELDYTTSYPISNIIAKVTAARVSNLWKLAQQTTLFMEVLVAPR